MHTLRTIIFVFGKNVLLRKPSLWSAGFVRPTCAGMGVPYDCEPGYDGTVTAMCTSDGNYTVEGVLGWCIRKAQRLWPLNSMQTLMKSNSFTQNAAGMLISLISLISYHFPHPQHPGHCKTASSVETRSLRSKLTGVSGAVRHCNYHDMFMVMIIPYHARKKFENLKFSCLGKEFIIDGLRFLSRDASLRRLYSHGGWERFDSCWPGTLWMAEVGDPCRGLLGYEITSIILNHLRLKIMRSWWLWMLVNSSSAKFQVPKGSLAQRPRCLANRWPCQWSQRNGGNAGGPRRAVSDWTGQFSKLTGNSRKSNVLGSKQRASQRVSLF